jgi:hypothetical protein
MFSVLLIGFNLTCVVICGLSIRVSQLKNDNRTILNLSRNVINEVHVIKIEKDEMRKKIKIFGIKLIPLKKPQLILKIMSKREFRN